jgi:NADPH2:quinone reductase
LQAIQISRIGAPDVLESVSLPTPTPGAGEVLIEAHSIGVNFFDILIRTGRYPWMPDLPFVPGNDMSGYVAAVGSGATKFKVGQPVFVTGYDLDHGGGLYAEFAIAPQDAVWALPENIDLEHATTLTNYQLAWLLLHAAARGVEPKTVLVHGAAGGVGTALADVSRLAGAKVIGVAGSAAKCDFVRQRGATHAVDPNAGPLVQKIMTLTDGCGVDILFDHIAGKNFTDGLKILAPFGVIVSYGLLGGMPETNLFKEMRSLVARSPAVRCFSIHSYDDDPAPRRAAMEQAIGILASGKVKPAIAERIPLAQAARAHEMLERRGALGKIILKP